MLHGLKVHFEPLQMDQKQFRALFDHHLPGGHLLAITVLAVEFVANIQELFRAEFFEAIAKRGVFLNIDR